MTVQEVREMLDQFNPESEVRILSDGMQYDVDTVFLGEEEDDFGLAVVFVAEGEIIGDAPAEVLEEFGFCMDE